ncbi:MULTISPECIES: hypothetical protein [Streptomyces]|uniref:hypothetical protein n=1 Tax=Streptomyces TaxID=1883 RepID=UPI0004CDB01F|nr:MULTISPECIES: hypothetical protein [Streptomyces]KOT47120.1 hypothetical protein ADK43_40295 [Streptomyces rimosus subsp. rimosus]
MNGNLISFAELRAAQNKSLERIGLHPVSDSEFDAMRYKTGEDFMTEYRYNRRGTTMSVVGAVTEWVRAGKSVEATKHEVRVGGTQPVTYRVIETPRGTYDGADCSVTLDGKFIAHAATLARALYLIQRHFVYGTVDYHEITDRAMFLEHTGDGLDILVNEGPDFDLDQHSADGSFMFTYINDYDPCSGEYSFLVNDDEAMATANWAFVDGTKEDPADWRIKSIDYYSGEPAVTYYFTDARVPNTQDISPATPAGVVTPELPHPSRVTFEQLAAIDWGSVPVDGDDHHDAHALAGSVRDFNEYYAPENAHLRSTVEGWLTNYSAARTYREES